MTKIHPKVIVGKDDFLFLGGADSNELERYLTGKLQISDAASCIWRENILQRKARLPRMAGVIIPEGHVVYADKLPAHFPIAARRPVHSVLNIAAPQFRYIDSFLKQARKNGVVVYTGNDSHWTEHAALETWKELRKVLGRSGEFKTTYEPRLSNEPHDLRAKIVDPIEAEKLSTRHWRKTDAVMVFETNIMNRGSASIFYNSAAPEGRLLVFGTSFGLRLLPFYGVDFREVMSVYGTSVDWQVVREWQPDEVLMEMPERFVHFPSIDLEGPSLPLAMLARGGIIGNRARCFSINVNPHFLSEQSQAFLERARSLDAWLTELIRGGSPSGAALSQLGLADDTLQLAILMRARPSLFAVIMGMYRSEVDLQAAFAAVDAGELRIEHVKHLPRSEMGDLVRVRLLLRAGQRDAADAFVVELIQRFGMSKEADFYAKYLNLQRPAIAVTP